MARISLGICLMMLVVASSVIYEAQGTFLLKMYLRKNFPRKCNEFTPYAKTGMITFVTNLESSCPATAEFKDFFSKFKAYMNFLETAPATSKNIDVQITTQCDGLFKAMSALNGGAAGKSADAGSFKVTMISMGKTLMEQKKSAVMMTLAQKKSLVQAMVKWTKMIATFVKTASEKKGKTIDIKSYELDVDANDKSIMGASASASGSGSSESGSSSTKTENASSTKTKTGSSPSGSTNTKTEGGSTYKDTTGGYSGSPSGSPTGSPSVTGKTSAKGSAGASGSASSSKKESATGSTSVKQVETETSKEVMSFIMELEKKYSSKVELKVFFEKLKASMTASATISSKTAKDYVAMTRSATGKLSEAMSVVGSRAASKSAKMKSNIETAQEKLMRTLKELQDINSKIVSEKTVTATQKTELKQTITKFEQVTTQFVETCASSSSSFSSSFSSSQQSIASSQQRSASSQQGGSMRMVKNN